MSRYLTPPKIGLLALVLLYLDLNNPSHLHAATIPILSFITSHIVPSPPASTSNDAFISGSNRFAISIEDFEDLLRKYEARHPGRTLWDAFLKLIWTIDNFDALHKFFDYLRDVVARTKDEALEDAENGIVRPTDKITLSRTSPLGAFVRRCSLEFTRLQFDDASKLWIAWVAFRAPTDTEYLKKNPAASSFDSSISEDDPENQAKLLQIVYDPSRNASQNDLMLSADDIERILGFQVERLQRLGNRVPDNMKTQLRAMLATPSPSAPPALVHFVKFFDAWRAGDYTTSFDSLHQYFDYTMQSSSAQGQQQTKTHYQYALLHMAILHADFGCFAEALSALHETIQTARENQDHNCLNFALSWLSHLKKVYQKEMSAASNIASRDATRPGQPAMSLSLGGGGTERDGLSFLKVKARENKMWSLLSSTLLSEAKSTLSTGGSIPHAFEQLLQSSQINLVHNLPQQAGIQQMMTSSIYSRLGISHLAGAYSSLLLDTPSYTSLTPTEEVLRATCRTAHIHAQQGNYTAANNLLASLESNVHRTLRFHQYITCYTGMLRLKRCLRRHDLSACSSLLSRLRPLAGLDPELTFLVADLDVEYHIATRCYSTAFALLTELLSIYNPEDPSTDLYQRIHLLTLKATLFAHSGNPEKGFTVAMRAAAAAWRARNMPALWEAVGALTRILNALGECRAARDALEAIVPQALEGGDMALCAELYALQGDAYMGMAGKTPVSDPSTSSKNANEEENASELERHRAALVARAELYTDRARLLYKRVEDIKGECGCLAKKSVVAKLRGDEKLAEDWAENYCRTWEEGMKRNESGVGDDGGGQSKAAER